MYTLHKYAGHPILDNSDLEIHNILKKSLPITVVKRASSVALNALITIESNARSEKM